MDDLKLRARACVSCKFYLPPKPGDGMGQCHRFPPVIQQFILGFKETEGDQPGGPIFHSAISFPLTTETQWCGEHRPKMALP